MIFETLNRANDLALRPNFHFSPVCLPLIGRADRPVQLHKYSSRHLRGKYRVFRSLTPAYGAEALRLKQRLV